MGTGGNTGGSGACGAADDNPRSISGDGRPRLHLGMLGRRPSRRAYRGSRCKTGPQFDGNTFSMIAQQWARSREASRRTEGGWHTYFTACRHPLRPAAMPTATDVGVFYSQAWSRQGNLFKSLLANGFSLWHGGCLSRACALGCEQCTLRRTQPLVGPPDFGGSRYRPARCVLRMKRDGCCAHREFSWIKIQRRQSGTTPRTDPLARCLPAGTTFLRVRLGRWTRAGAGCCAEVR